MHSEFYTTGEKGYGNTEGANHGAEVSLGEYLDSEIGKSPNTTAGTDEPRYIFVADAGNAFDELIATIKVSSE
jgi:hypothetical protein